MDTDVIISKVINLVSTWGIKVVGVLIALLIAWIVAGTVSRSVAKRFQKSKFDATLSKFFANMIRYAILGATIIGLLGVFGVETTSFAALIGAAGLAIGLAFQGTLGNFASGVMLLVFRPFKVGDLVKAAGQLGIVTQVDLFTTEFATLDNRCVIIPNSAIFGTTIENLTHYPTRRVDVSIGADYGADIEATRAALEKVPGQVSLALADPAPQIFLAELGASSVDWKLRVWSKTEDYWDVYQEIIRLAKKAMEEADISIPFPQMDVHMDKPLVEALKNKRAV